MVARGAYAWIAGLGAAVFAGCGSSAAVHGAPDARSPDADQERDVAVASDTTDTSDGGSDAAGPSDTDGSPCALGTGTIVVSVGGPFPIVRCDCNWYSAATDAAASSGSMDNVVDGFTVSCLPAEPDYSINCTCDTNPEPTLGICTGNAVFSVAPGTTTDVEVSFECPG